MWSKGRSCFIFVKKKPPIRIAPQLHEPWPRVTPWANTIMNGTMLMDVELLWGLPRAQGGVNATKISRLPSV